MEARLVFTLVLPSGVRRAPVWTLLTSGELTVTPRGPRAECRALRPTPCSQVHPSDWGLRGAPRMGALALNGHRGREVSSRPVCSLSERRGTALYVPWLFPPRPRRAFPACMVLITL